MTKLYHENFTKARTYWGQVLQSSKLHNSLFLWTGYYVLNILEQYIMLLPVVMLAITS